MYEHSKFVQSYLFVVVLPKYIGYFFINLRILLTKQIKIWG